MSSPPVSRENSRQSLAFNEEGTSPPQERNSKAAEQGAKSSPPQLKQKPQENNPNTSGDKGFSKEDWVKHGQGTDDQQAQNKDQSKEKSSQGDEQKSDINQADTRNKGKAASNTRKPNIPTLRLPTSSGPAPGKVSLKNREPAVPVSTSGLASHRTLSPRSGTVSQENPSSSTTSSADTAHGHTATPTKPARSLPPIPKTSAPQTSQISTTNVPASARSTEPKPNNPVGMPANQLSVRSQLILDSAIITGSITPEELGFLLVEVQTEGFTAPISKFSQGTPFLRGGLKVLNFQASNGVIYQSINLIEKFLEPMAEKTFNTKECHDLRKTALKNYLPIASAVENEAKGMRPQEMQQSEKIKNLMDPVIRPFADWVCGENENLSSSQLPEVWKSMLLGIDGAVVEWAKKTSGSKYKEIMRLRSEALIAFISTRGYMMAWGTQVQSFGTKYNIKIEKFNSFLNSYFSHRAGRFIADIMLSRPDAEGDQFDSQMRGYIKVVSGQKDLVSKAPKQSVLERRQLMKSKTLQSTKAPQSKSSSKAYDQNVPLSPRMKEKIEVEETRKINQEKSVVQRQKFFRDFSKLAHLAEISPEFLRAFQKYVVEEMSDRAYEKFVKDPVQICTKYISRFYVGILNKERQNAEKSLRESIAKIQQQDIEVIAPKAEQLKSHTKPQPKTIQTPRGYSLAEDVSVTQSPVQKPQISGARREQFYGNFIFYTEIHELSEDFLKSFKHYVFELSATEYEKFEASPIDVCRAYVDEFYTSHVVTTTRVARERAERHRGELIAYLRNPPAGSLESLRKSMANPSPSFSNEVTAVASPPVDLGFECPPNPFEEDEAADARILPTSTASTLPLQDSIKLPVGRIQLNQGDKISESEKTETSSKESTEVVTESDSDADANDADSESEKTEKS